MFKRLILHAGTHKTGTSAIQRWLDRSSGELRAQGVLYPATGQVHNAHHAWANAVWHGEANPSAISDLLDGLERERQRGRGREAEPDTVILSTELIEKVPLNEHLIEPLSLLLKSLADEVTVVVFFRRQDELVESVFKQWVKDPNVRLAAPVTRFVDGHDRAIDYHHITKRWLAVGAVDEVRPVSNALRSDPIAAFAHRLADVLDPATIDTVDRSALVNPSLDGKGLELKWLLNTLSLSPDDDQVVLNRLVQAVDCRERLSLFTSEDRGRFLDRYHDANQRLITEFGIDPFDQKEPTRDRLFARPSGQDLRETVARLAAGDAGVADAIWDGLSTHLHRAR